MSTLANRRALYGKMAGDTTLNGLLAAPPAGFAKSIYYQMAPQAASFPYVIFSKQAGTPTYALALPTAMDSEVWLIKGVARNTPGEVTDSPDSIAARLDALLTDGTLSISGATKLYLRRESDVDYAEPDGDKQYRHAGSLFRLIATP